MPFPKVKRVVNNKARKGGSRTIKPIPNLNFVKIQRQVIQTTEEVKKLRNFSFMMKMRKTILVAQILLIMEHILTQA